MVASGKEFVNEKIEKGQQVVEKKSSSLLGEITEKIQETAQTGVGAVT